MSAIRVQKRVGKFKVLLQPSLPDYSVSVQVIMSVVPFVTCSQSILSYLSLFRLQASHSGRREALLRIPHRFLRRCKAIAPWTPVPHSLTVKVITKVIFFVFLLVLLPFNISLASKTESNDSEMAQQFLSPESDPRKFHMVTLENNLTVLLVSDEATENVRV